MQLPPRRSYLRLNLYSAVHITDHSMFYSSHGLSQDEINKLACSQCIRKSLFTSIPLPTGSRLHWEFYLRTLLLNDHNLQTTLWTCSTSACLTSTYFQYNGKNYKKVARYSYGLSCFCDCSRNCEELAIATYMRTVPLWLSYVDDTFTFVPLQTQTKSTIFTNTLDRRRTYSYQGIEENGKIPFLDCLVTVDNNRLRTTI